ncbi:hypothetical protein L3049_07090 [Labilibaculum sp. DW002]|uniref:Uncharacterized protein n=1 Tax=Paralabilibaculum antarcticum TaxID=2912572 RepID=A0ABT5VQS1_9BACT|nr:hypothetical protein [Labilibaculum sp. DW002]MDE5417770.1 hypothetical protein [Labilibaculum sp. DW002]
MKKNIFIKALEYGEDKIEIGVSFNELIEFLEPDLTKTFKSPEKKDEFKKSFNVWFYDHFYLRTIQTTRNGIYSIPAFDLMDKHNGDKARLKGDAYFKLIEYKELNESRKSSRNAFIIASVAALLTFISVSYQVFYDGQVLNESNPKKEIVMDTLRNSNIEVVKNLEKQQAPTKVKIKGR